MAAAYLDHLVHNHPFMDGNKRVAILAAYTFLRLNGQLVAGEDEFETVILGAAHGILTREEVGAFIRDHCQAEPV